MIPINEIKITFKEYSDSKIEYIAKHESNELRKEVLPILENEIILRGLDKDLISWFKAETNPFSEMEKASIINKIQHLNCSKCSSKIEKLYGFEINTITAFIFIFRDSSEKKILCRRCGNLEKSKSMFSTFFLGWWSRTGIISTPYTLIKDVINLMLYKEKISNKILNDIVEDNVGVLRIEGCGLEELNNLVLLHNTQYLEEKIISESTLV